MTAFALSSPDFVRQLLALAAGADGKLWVSENLGNQSTNISTTELLQLAPGSGAILSEHPIPGATFGTPFYGSQLLVSGPDGALWLSGNSSGLRHLGRMTLSGSFTDFPLNSSGTLSPSGLTSGPGNALWLSG